LHRDIGFARVVAHDDLNITPARLLEREHKAIAHINAKPRPPPESVVIMPIFTSSAAAPPADAPKRAKALSPAAHVDFNVM
jgi:hypothetical protein